MCGWGVGVPQGDNFLLSKLAGSFNKKSAKGEKMEKGIAFPTCCSINNTVCHFSPVTGDETVLKAGDSIKVDLGCHVDGFIAVAATTKVLAEGKVTGKQADVMMAAKTGTFAVHQLGPNPRAHACGFFQPALGFLPTLTRRGQFLPLPLPWDFSSLPLDFHTNLCTGSAPSAG